MATMLSVLTQLSLQKIQIFKHYNKNVLSCMHVMYLLLTAILLMTLCYTGECMYNSTRPVIWTEHPYVIRLLITAPDPDPRVFKCTGVLVARNKALTTAHCINRPLEQMGDAKPEIMVQHLGQQMNKQTGELELRWILRPVVQATVLPRNPQNPLSTDMAMLYLSKNDHANEPIADCEWAEISDEMPEQGQLVTMLGFDGLKKEDQPVYLQQIWAVPVRHILAFNLTLTFSHLNGNIQAGDSGGPVIDTDTGDLIGLITNGRKTNKSADSQITLHSAADNRKILTKAPSALVLYLHGHLPIINKFIADADLQFEPHQIEEQLEVVDQNEVQYRYTVKVRDEL